MIIQFIDHFHDEFQCCGWSSRFDIPNRYFWSANHCQIDLDDYGVRYLPTWNEPENNNFASKRAINFEALESQEKLFNVRFIFNSSILSLVLIKVFIIKFRLISSKMILVLVSYRRLVQPLLRVRSKISRIEGEISCFKICRRKRQGFKTGSAKTYCLTYSNTSAIKNENSVLWKNNWFVLFRAGIWTK